MTNNSWNSDIPIEVSLGGTGNITLTAHGVLLGNGTGSLNVTGDGNTSEALTSNGDAVDPSFQVGGTGVTIVPPTTWTPTIEGSTTAGTISYTLQQGVFYRVGSVVWAEINIEGSFSSGTNPEGDILVKALPLTPSFLNGICRENASISVAGSSDGSITHTVIFDADTTLKFVYNGWPTNLPPPTFSSFDPLPSTGVIRIQSSFWYTV